MRISDWSSDVCSSDLRFAQIALCSIGCGHWIADIGSTLGFRSGLAHFVEPVPPDCAIDCLHRFAGSLGLIGADEWFDEAFIGADPINVGIHTPLVEIGRASCRERVCQYVAISGVAVS